MPAASVCSTERVAEGSHVGQNSEEICHAVRLSFPIFSSCLYITT